MFLETGWPGISAGDIKWLSRFRVAFGWAGSVPLACMVLTSLLKAVMSPSFLSRVLLTALRGSSKCSAMKGVAVFTCWSTFKPLSPASTSSTESTTPECELSLSFSLFADRLERRGFKSTLAFCSISKMSTLFSAWSSNGIGAK
jgi:hypothetical protein